jgi:hypothetical protein
MIEENLLQIYQSAIIEMKREIFRLNRCLLKQHYITKLKTLNGQVSSLTDQLSTHNLTLSPTSVSRPSSSKFTLSPTKISQTDLLKVKISEAANKLNRLKSTSEKEQKTLLERLKITNGKLFLLVFKLKDASNMNMNLKKKVRECVDERKRMLTSYAKITKEMKSELTASELVRKIEEAEKRNKINMGSLGLLTNMIAEIKGLPRENDQELNKKLARITEIEEEHRALRDKRREIQIKIEEITADIEIKKRNPEQASIVAISRFCRGEIKDIQLQIAEKSKLCKELEREKLQAQVNYAEVEKKREKPATPRVKSVSQSNTHSTLQTVRSSTRINASRDCSFRGNRGIAYGFNKNDAEIVKIMAKEKEGTLNREVIKALEFYAPGRSITEKIMAFNRGDLVRTSRK